MGRKKAVLRKISTFCISNVLGTVVDTGVLWLSSDFLFTSYLGQYILSPVISFECAVLTNFLCSWFFIWSDRIKTKSPSVFFHKYLYYNLSATGVFFIKMAFLLLFERLFGWDVVWCNLLALCISGGINFSIGEWLIFRKKQ